MLTERTGGRYDGQDWPPRGGEFDVPDGEGAALCAQGDAVPVVTQAAQIPEQPDPAVETRALPEPESPAAEPESPAAEPEPPAPPEASAAADSPSARAQKAAWVDFAVSQGFDRGVAGSMTKADLMARFGRDQGAPAQ